MVFTVGFEANPVTSTGCLSSFPSHSPGRRAETLRPNSLQDVRVLEDLYRFVRERDLGAHVELQDLVLVGLANASMF